MTRIIPSLFRSGWETVSQPLYDFVTVPGGRNVVRFFANPRGEHKSLGDTNLDLPGALPSGVEFLIREVELIPPARHTLEPGSSLSLYIMSRRYLAVSADMATGRPYSFANAELLLQSSVVFSVEVEAFAARKTPYRMGVVLHGFQYRKVA